MKQNFNFSENILVGGRALVALGSDRSTSDTDYLVNDPTSAEMFLHDEENNVDYLNAAASPFFAEIFAAERGRQIASPQSLLELKAYSLVQHCQNFNWAKVAATEYDINFLVRTFNLTAVSIVARHISAGELKEVNKEIASVRK